MQDLKQSTAATILVGPVLDEDGTPYTTDDLAYGDFKLTKAGSVGSLNASATVAHSHQGHFTIALTSGDVDTLGRLDLSLNKATLAMPMKSMMVRAAAWFNTVAAASGGSIPNAAADDAGGLPISDAGGLDMDTLAAKPAFQIASAGGWTEIAHGETVHLHILTHNPLTGELADADSAPTWKIWGQTGDTPCLTGSFTKRTGYTGHYKASFGVETVNGFDPGEFFEVVAEATVGGVAEKIVLMSFRVLAAETAAGKPAVDAESIADAVLSRDMSEVEADAPEHSLCTVVLAALESSISSTEWVIKRTDGATTHVTKTVTTDADAEPITGVS